MNRDESLGSKHTEVHFEAILELVLRAYHQGEVHGGAHWIGENILDAELVPITREAFLDADDMPPDHEVLRILDNEDIHLIGEGYHVVTLTEPASRFVVKYVKQAKSIPPLAPSDALQGRDWAHDHGLLPDGCLHAAIWQHIRSFESYGPLAVSDRIYLADSAYARLNSDQRRVLERFRLIGIVRSLGSVPRMLRVEYPDDFPFEKRAPDGVAVSVLVMQPHVTTVAAAIERELQAGNSAAAQDLVARYMQFVHDLWRYGVSHLDFSILNIGITGSGAAEQFRIFDPHMGSIEIANGAQEVQDPLSEHPPGRRSIRDLLRSARDGTRWALWRIQEDARASPDIAEESAALAAKIVREFHVGSSGIEQRHGAFSLDRFDWAWRQRGNCGINTVLHAQLWKFSKHPVCGLLRSLLEGAAPDAIYDRALSVVGMDDERPLPQFRAGLKLYCDRPLVLIANVTDNGPRLVKHWGRLRLPPEVDVQNDPAIHYHLRDLLTGEMYVRSGEDLARRGFVVGLAPGELHALQVEDVAVQDVAVERALAVHRDVSEFLKDCTRRIGVIGDVHGELDALKEVLRALGFIDSSDQWSTREGTLVFTGDVGHGRHLQDVFDFLHRLAAQAHRLGGKVVWTLGNHDLYVDREGGQGGEESHGYRLWPTIREAALQPERHPGLVVCAAYFDCGKLFVHGGVLPNVVDVAMREQDARQPEEIAAYVNDVFRRVLLERERIAARDLPHEIFRIGTSHARDQRLPGEIGYEPAGIFTPDLREVDHYRYHDRLMPQIVGHTASKHGEIRYSPGSCLQRDYIAIDVGRQHGTGNGGLLLTDFGWVAVTPGGPARLVEVGSLFVTLAHKAAAGGTRSAESGEEYIKQALTGYFRAAKSQRSSRGEMQGSLVDLSPAQIVALEQILAAIRQTGRCILVTDLDEMLAAFSGADVDHSTVEVLANYLAAGGVLVFNIRTSFDWFYYSLHRSLIVRLGPLSRVLSNLLLVLSGGNEIYVFEGGAYRLVSRIADKDPSEGFDELVTLSRERRFPSVPEIDPLKAVYIGDSSTPAGLSHAMTGKVGFVIDVGDTTIKAQEQFVSRLHCAYLRMVDLIIAASTALNESEQAKVPELSPDVGDTELWTFERKYFPSNRRLRVRVAGSGYVHAGIARADGNWDPVYNVPLMPVMGGEFEAILPAGVDRFTFFWTEAPWTPGHPGHWERQSQGGRVFEAIAAPVGN